MSCFPCFSSKKSNSNESLPVAHAKEASDALLPSSSPGDNRQTPPAEVKNKEDDTVETGNIASRTFAFRELATATKNFRKERLIGDGGFGKVFKGTLQPSGQVVAVKQLDRNGMQGNKEFLVGVLTLSLLKHQNLVNLIGYCADGDQRLLVYEFMPLGSLETHLLDKSDDKKPLDWVTRMKIALGVAQGLEYLHEKANPPVIYRDLKASNILLGEGFTPRLSDFGLAKLSQSGNTASVPPRVMGSYGYCAPEYARNSELTLKSDIYNFGVVLLELITGRRAVDPKRSADEQNLVTWAQPIFRDPKRFPEMADPLLNREFSVKCLNQAVGVAAMCLEEEPSVRPFITDVVAALSFLQLVKDEPDPSTCNLRNGTPEDAQNDDKVDSSDSKSEDTSSDHEEEKGHVEKQKSGKEHKIDHEDRSTSSTNLLADDSESVDYDEDDEEEEEEEHDNEEGDEDDQVSRKSQTKSIKSKKNKVELSDDESMYSSSSRSSSISISDE